MSDILERMSHLNPYNSLELAGEARDEIQSVRSKLDAFRRHAITRDNGYDRCRFCEAWGHMGEPLTEHLSWCPARDIAVLDFDPRHEELSDEHNR